MNEHHDGADSRLSHNGRSDPSSDRRAELLGAAAADDLSPAERQELGAMSAKDPELAQELSELRELSNALRGDLSSASAEAPSADLRKQVIEQANSSQVSTPKTKASEANAPQTSAPETSTAQTSGSQVHLSEASPTAHESPVPSATRTRTRSRPRAGSRLRQSLALAACVAVGVVGTLGVQAVMDTDSTGTDPGEPADGLVAEEPLGPPGELGAQEPVSFSDPGAGIEVDGALVAHTWGTETVLQIDGLTPGDAFTVVLIGADGEEIESGSFLGSEVPVDCRMNGAVLREEAERLEIRDDAGLAITAAALPDVD